MVWMSVQLNSNPSTESIQFTWYDVFHLKKVSLKSSGGFVCQDASNGARLSLGHFIRNNVQLLGNPNSSSANRTTAVSEDDSQQQPKNEDKRGKQGGKVLNRITRTQLFRFSDHSRRPVGEVGFTSKREERKKKEA